MKVNISVANQRLFVGNIPKSKTRDEIFEEFAKIASGLIDVIIYASPDDIKKKNRGFAFLEYDTHKSGILETSTVGISCRGSIYNKKDILGKIGLLGGYIWLFWGCGGGP